MPADLLGGLLDQLADTIAERVIARIDAHFLETKSGPQDAYRIEQAATTLGLSAREIKRRVASGELASIKVGRARLVPQRAIADFLASRDRTAA